MTVLADRYIAAPNFSEGWLDAVRLLHTSAGRKAVHLVVRIADPTREDRAIRLAAEELIDGWNAGRSRPQDEMEQIESTRNTIFPASYARRTPSLEELAAYYRKRYTKAGLLGFPRNSRGTYFGRMVAYPRGDETEPGDQLSSTLRKLRQELETGSNKSSRYEISIYNERVDRSPMSFPCLAHISLHLHEHQLHMQAVYRNEFLIGRAYGNYLGLAQLQAYIATAAGVGVGELLITAGHVELDGHRQAVGAMLARLSAVQAS